MSILAIDPGNTQSAYVYCNDNLTPLEFGKEDNNKLLTFVHLFPADILVIEKIASYGMAVGAEVFDTCIWTGRFQQLWELQHEKNRTEFIFRREVKLNLCGSMKAKDGNIRQALIDRFGVVGTKKEPGWFYGFKADIWAAYAVAVTYRDKMEPK